MAIEAYDITLEISVSDKHTCTDDCPEDQSCLDIRRLPTADEANTLLALLCDRLAWRYSFTGGLNAETPTTASLYVVAAPVRWWRSAWTAIRFRASWWLWHRWRNSSRSLAQEPRDSAARTAGSVTRLRHPEQPLRQHQMLVMVPGVPGAGKSHFAARLAETAGIEHLNSGIIGRELFGLDSIGCS